MAAPPPSAAVSGLMQRLAKCFVDGNGFGYLSPYMHGAYHGKLVRSPGCHTFRPRHDELSSRRQVRFPLHDFTAGAVEVLELTLVDPDLKGFYGGYATGGHGYLIPYHNGDRSITPTRAHCALCALT